MKRDLLYIIDDYLMEEDSIDEARQKKGLKIFTEPDIEKPVETRNLKFTKKNIEKIARDYDAKIEEIDIDLKSAMLKDRRNRILFVSI